MICVFKVKFFVPPLCMQLFMSMKFQKRGEKETGKKEREGGGGGGEAQRYEILWLQHEYCKHC